VAVDVKVLSQRVYSASMLPQSVIMTRLKQVVLLLLPRQRHIELAVE
jgi:hypothetical protein